MIRMHLHYTGSERARRILERWDEYRGKFRKVMPVEYRRALQEMAKAQAADKTGFGVLEIGVDRMPADTATNGRG
jgi:glutamate synthase (NADPH/NADH) large chain